TYELFRDLMREARDFSPKTMTIVAGLELIDFIREEESLTFSDLQALLKIPIRLQVDSAYRHGQYDIALG
ncbi:MAG: Rne/Rng family ribonuclease, partial [Cardiobacterium sp.]